MKTKIIYISGAEVFDMADVRAAFEEIRGVLNLGADTIMFGVPVDADSALAVPATAPVADVVAAPVADVVPDVEMSVADVVVDTEIAAVAESVPAADAVVTEVASPAPKKRGRTKKAAVKEQPVVNDDDAVVPVDAPADVAAPIPILSVLAAQDEPVSDAPATDVDVAVPADDAEQMEPETEQISEAEHADVAMPDIEVASIDEIIADEDAGDIVDAEQTLEELLDSTTPLREEKDGLHVVADADASDEYVDSDDIIDDTDATLEQLAAEFAQNEDKIVAAPKAANRGKIGKLKNILPFSGKKTKRDDTGLMGDLFGWAGIAANDDDFSIPGFLH